MTFRFNKTGRLVTAALIMLGIGNALMGKTSAKHVRYHYRHHHKARFHKRKYRTGTWKKRWIHGKVHFYWYRYKNKKRFRYRKFQQSQKHRRNRKKKPVKVARIGAEVTYKDKNIDAMDNVKQMEYQTIKKINVDRAAHNLEPLRATVELRRLARQRAHQSAQLDYLTHVDSQGHYYYEENAKGMKIPLGNYSGENIASAGLGQILMDNNDHVYQNNNGEDMANMDEDEMVYHDQDSNWGHRYNTLNSHYRTMGVGAEQRPGTNNYYLAENFSS